MNNVSLIGRLANEPVIHQGNTEVVTVLLAVKRSYKSKQNTDFIPLSLFNKTAQTLTRYTKVGDLIGISGTIRTSNYTDKDGAKRYTWEVAVSSLSLIGSGNSHKQQPSASQSTTAGIDLDLPTDMSAMPTRMSDR